MGGGITASDCQHRFLSISFSDNFLRAETEKGGKEHDGIHVNADSSGANKNEEIMDDNNYSKLSKEITEKLVQSLTKNVSPVVVAATVNAALKSSGGNINQSQKASLSGAIACQAALNAREQENTMNQLLMEILDQKMEKLENRLALLDDMESLFEAERVALELERRDLYTTRCRQWFGNGK